MFLVTLICSDRVCAEEVDLVVEDLGVLDIAACDCGCTQVAVAVAEWEPAPVAMLV